MGTIREMTIHDYEPMIQLWSSIEGLALSNADSKENIQRYLERNQGLSYVWEQDKQIVGTILCGHDGRRGFIYHVAVNPDYRNQKIGHQLVQTSLNQLRREGIDKCHIFVIEDNAIGNGFWSASGWEKRSGFYVYSKNT
ncbi:GNAT family N-acetyltransferase [Paenibacillus sp. MMS18-CY102]|uniref:GNAT family N-acetyltransferase n=1 Tax=Paenibacillus sp. MMS18-CY102 TaxID=2682849 RepID=UPI001366443B|nr:GNAT family N-acetyltransferase [Paenibacillus sp. MMS18-CY102]MWC27683.1 GNAT family N-acetyltransferase [Paenibacillus sp. MMS18-CY102]